MKRYRTIAWLDFNGELTLDTAGDYDLAQDEREKKAIVVWTDYPQASFDDYIAHYGRERWWGVEVDWDEEKEIVAA